MHFDYFCLQFQVMYQVYCILNKNKLILPVFVKKSHAPYQMTQNALLKSFYYTKTYYSLFPFLSDQTGCMSGQALSLAWQAYKKYIYLQACDCKQLFRNTTVVHTC